MSGEPSGSNASLDEPIPARRPRARLGPSEAAILKTFVVPRYLSLFGDLALEMLVESDEARVAHLGCRTGYPDRGIARKLPGAHIIGVDGSAAALELARAKAATMPEMVSTYVLADGMPTDLPSSAFSHALTLHAPVGHDERVRWLAEFVRLLGAHGQVLVTLPMRGSFQEIIDLLREWSLKSDDVAMDRATDRAASVRPTAEGLSGELESGGFDFVDVAVRPTVLRFQSGRDFFEDPCDKDARFA